MLILGSLNKGRALSPSCLLSASLSLGPSLRVTRPHSLILTPTCTFALARTCCRFQSRCRSHRGSHAPTTFALSLILTLRLARTRRSLSLSSSVSVRIAFSLSPRPHSPAYSHACSHTAVSILSFSFHSYSCIATRTLILELALTQLSVLYIPFSP